MAMKFMKTSNVVIMIEKGTERKMKTYEDIANEILYNSNFKSLFVVYTQYKNCFDTLLQYFNKYFEIKETNGNENI